MKIFERLRLFLLILLLILITLSVTCYVFETDFAEMTIDWFAFLAGLFLVSEGLYRLSKTGAGAGDIILIITRIVIGTCVFTIHLMQFMRK